MIDSTSGSGHRFCPFCQTTVLSQTEIVSTQYIGKAKACEECGYYEPMPGDVREGSA